MSYNLRHFVDREPQLAAFEARVKGGGKCPVLLFHGPEGAGKTWMLYRLRELCGKARTTYALLDLQHDGLETGEAIILRLGLKIGGAFGEAIWRECEALERESRKVSGGDISDGMASDELQATLEMIKRELPGLVAQGRLLDQAGAGTLPEGQQAASRLIFSGIQGNVRDRAKVQTGVVNIAVDIYFNQTKEHPAPEEELKQRQKRRTGRLSQAWEAALEEQAAKEPVVLLFDSCEYASDDASEWLRDHLVEPLLNGRFASCAKLAVVLGGDPEKNRGIWLDTIAGLGEGVAPHELGKLPPEAVRKYWIEIRHLDERDLPRWVRRRGTLPYRMVEMADDAAEA